MGGVRRLVVPASLIPETQMANVPKDQEGEPLRFDEDSWQQVLAWFERLQRPCPESNRRQAELPASSAPLTNTTGTAPGFFVGVHGATFFAMPGVPRVQQLGELTPTAHRLLRVIGPSEAMLGERIGDHMLPGRNPQVGITASGGLLTVRVVATAPTREQAAALCEGIADELRPKLGDWLFAEGEEELPELVLARLREQGRTVAFAESCTATTACSTVGSCSSAASISPSSTL